MQTPITQPSAERCRAGTRGFSLLEVLVALAIIAIAVTLLLQLLSTDLRAIVRSGNMTSAAMRADSKMREILAGSGSSEKAWSETTEDGYRMDIVMREALQERTGSLPVKMMEVVVTVRWLEGMREKNLSFTTLKMADKMTPAEGTSRNPL